MRHFFATSIVEAAYSKTVMASTLRFIATNKDDVLPNNDIVRKLLSTTSSISTPIQTLYKIVTETNTDFGVVYVPTTIRDIPEGITYQAIPLDVDQMLAYGDNDALRLVCQTAGIEKKLLVPVMGIYSTQRQSLTDIEAFQSSILKVFLTRLYYNSKNRFLSPELINQLGSIYSILMGRMIGAFYDLSTQEVNQLQAIMLYFFYTLMMDAKEVPDYYRANAVQSLRAQEVDVDFIIELFEGVDVTLSTVMNEIIPKKLDIIRLQKFNAGVFRQKTSMLLGDPITSALFMTYAPYFIYGLLQAFSGKKISITYRIQALGLKPHDVKTLLDKLGQYIRYHS